MTDDRTMHSAVSAASVENLEEYKRRIRRDWVGLRAVYLEIDPDGPVADDINQLLIGLGLDPVCDQYEVTFEVTAKQVVTVRVDGLSRDHAEDLAQEQWESYLVPTAWEVDPEVYAKHLGTARLSKPPTQ